MKWLSQTRYVTKVGKEEMVARSGEEGSEGLWAFLWEWGAAGI